MSLGVSRLLNSTPVFMRIKFPERDPKLKDVQDVRYLIFNMK